MLKLTYAALSLMGLVFTWYYNLKFIGETGGLELVAFAQACFVNAAASSITVTLSWYKA